MQTITEKRVYEKPVLEQVGFMIERTQTQVETSCCICDLTCTVNGGVCDCTLGKCHPK